MKNFLIKKLVFLVFGFAFFFPLLSFAQQIPAMDFYYGASCPHCKEEKKWFPELKKMYPLLEIREYEIWFDMGNKRLFDQHMKKLGATPTGVPVHVVEGEVLVGFEKDAVLSLIQKHYGDPVSEKKKEEKNPSDGWKKYLQSSWPIMALMLGFLDGFNPCAMWTLFILIGFLLSLEDKKKRLLIGSVFVGSSAVLYFAALLAYLLGFEAILQLVSGPIMIWVFRAVGIMALVTGLLAIKTFRSQGINCEVRDTNSKKKFHQQLSEILNREQMWLVLLGIIVLAFSVNSVELLCSFAIPTSFTATLVSLDLSWVEKIMALVLYDLAYIFDDMLVLVVALWTMNLKVFSPKLVQYSHLLGGLVLLGLGLLLIFEPGIVGKLF